MRPAALLLARVFLWLLLALLATVVFAGAALQSAWLRDSVLALALDASMDEWSIETVDGSLLTGVTVRGLRLEVEDAEVDIGRIEARPALGRILFGQAALRTLLLDQVQIRLPPPAPADDTAAPYRGFRLPVAVSADLLDLRGLAIHQGEALHVSGLDLSARLLGRDQRLALHDARVYWAAQGLLVRGAASLGLAAHLPFRLRLEGTRQDPSGGMPMLGAAAEIFGELAGARPNVRLESDLRGGVTGRLEATVDLATASGEARARVTALDWPGLPDELSVDDLDLRTTGSFNNQGTNLGTRLDWSMKGEGTFSAQRFMAEARGTLEEAVVKVTEATLTSDANRVELAASLALDMPRNFSARFTTADLDLSPWLPDWRSRLAATGTLAGSLGSNPAADLEVRLADLSLAGKLQDHDLETQIVASLDAARLTVSRALLTVDGNRVEFAGWLGRERPWDFDVQLGGQDLDLSSMVPEWPTRLGLETRLAGRLRAEDRRLDIHSLSVDGRWNDVPARLRAEHLQLRGQLPEPEAWRAALAQSFSGATTAPLTATQFEVGRLDLALGRNRLEASGRLDGALEGSLVAELPELAQFWPDIAGAAAVTVMVGGSASAPILDVDLALERVTLAGEQLQRARIRGRASADPQVATQLAFDFDELIVGEMQIDGRGEITGRWPLMTVASVVEVPAAGLTVDLAATGNPIEPRQLTLDRLHLDQALAGSWRLDMPVRIDPAADAATQATITAGCLRASEPTTALCWSTGNVVSTGPLEATGLDIDLTLEAFDLVRLAPFIPPALELDGAIAGRASVRGRDLDVRLDAGETLITVMNHADAEVVFEDRLERFVLDLSRRGHVVSGSVDARADLAGSMELEARAALDPALMATDLRAAMTGANVNLVINVDVSDLTPFGPLIPGIERTSGSLSGILRARGTASAPDLSGQLELRGSATVATLDLLLAPVTLTLRAESGQPASLTGELFAGEQKLDVRATADWSAAAGLTANGSLSGDAIALSALPDLNLTLKPNLHFTLDREAIRAAGTAVIPEAQARLRALPESGEVLSRDVVIHRAVGQEVDRPGRDLYLNLDVSLGERVFLSAVAGLDTRLTGRLLLTQGPQQPLSARGSLATRNGQFSIYGQTLALRQGRLNFDGPLENPSVDILAIRRVEEAEVGVQVSGFFDALETRLHSVPQRGETEALTMLITGRMPSEASSADLAQASDAALAFGIGQATPFMGRLVNQLGIDELAVDRPLDEEAGAILIGTRLTDDLYVRYSYGLHSRLGGLQIEYRISDWLSVQSETGVNQAVDLIFRREFR